MACDVSPVAMFFIKKKPEERDLTCPISVRPWLKNNFGVIRDQKKRKQITFIFSILESSKWKLSDFM